MNHFPWTQFKAFKFFFLIQKFLLLPCSISIIHVMGDHWLNPSSFGWDNNFFFQFGETKQMVFCHDVKVLLTRWLLNFSSWHICNPTCCTSSSLFAESHRLRSFSFCKNLSFYTHFLVAIWMRKKMILVLKGVGLFWIFITFQETNCTTFLEGF